MTAIGQLLDELRFELLKVVALNAFLDALILFLLLLLGASVFGMGTLFPLIVAVLAFLGDAWFRSRRLNMRYIEERNPELREMLRTAADNKEADSLMAHGLFADLIERVQRVSSGSFLDFQGLVTKIGVTFVLSVVLLSLAFFNVNIQKFANPLAGIEGRLGGYFHGGEANMTAAGLEQGADDIYGEPSIAKLGNEQVGITLERNLNQVDFANVKDASPDGASGLKDYPTDPDAQAAGAYTGGLEDITDRKTAAAYSQEIKR